MSQFKTIGPALSSMGAPATPAGGKGFKPNPDLTISFLNVGGTIQVSGVYHIMATGGGSAGQSVSSGAWVNGGAGAFAEGCWWLDEGDTFSVFVGHAGNGAGSNGVARYGGASSISVPSKSILLQAPGGTWTTTAFATGGQRNLRGLAPGNYNGVAFAGTPQTDSYIIDLGTGANRGGPGLAAGCGGGGTNGGSGAGVQNGGSGMTLLRKVA